MKIAFCMIVFEGDFVLKQCLKQIYPFANQILIAEGPVEYWISKGRTTSEDDTNNILNSFPDPNNKIKVVHGQFKEKDDQSNAYMELIDPDTDYIWMIDSDELYKTEDIVSLIEILKNSNPTSVGVRSCSFYGGFERYLTGFELNKDNFLRIFKYENNCRWITHRPPTIEYRNLINRYHIDSDTLYNQTGIQMYHYSYVFPRQVKNKIEYYKAKVSRDRCIDNYYNNVYLPWVNGTNEEKSNIENIYKGVHEWKPEVRGECYTEEFNGEHPEHIINDFEELAEKFNKELEIYGYNESN